MVSVGLRWPRCKEGRHRTSTRRLSLLTGEAMLSSLSILGRLRRVTACSFGHSARESRTCWREMLSWSSTKEAERRLETTCITRATLRYASPPFPPVLPIRVCWPGFSRSRQAGPTPWTSSATPSDRCSTLTLGEDRFTHGSGPRREPLGEVGYRPARGPDQSRVAQPAGPAKGASWLRTKKDHSRKAISATSKSSLPT